MGTPVRDWRALLRGVDKKIGVKYRSVLHSTRIRGRPNVKRTKGDRGTRCDHGLSGGESVAASWGTISGAELLSGCRRVQTVNLWDGGSDVLTNETSKSDGEGAHGIFDGRLDVRYAGSNLNVSIGETVDRRIFQGSTLLKPRRKPPNFVATLVSLRSWCGRRHASLDRPGWALVVTLYPQTDCQSMLFSSTNFKHFHANRESGVTTCHARTTCVWSRSATPLDSSGRYRLPKAPTA